MIAAAWAIILATVLLASCGPSGDTSAPEPLTPTVIQPDNGVDFTDPTTTTSTTARPAARGSRGRAVAPRHGDILDAIARCESGGNPRAVSRSGRYRGAWQFDRGTWAANGGTGDPIEHSYDKQKAVARTLLARRGLQPWPACRARL